jgi:hypothetical protein
MRAILAALAACTLAGCEAKPWEPSNLGAVPAYQAIASAKEDAVRDTDFPSDGMTLWNDSDIRPLARGWCVILHAVGYPSGRTRAIPVFVEQDGRAWRVDAVGRKRHNGGADGLNTAPITGAGCRIEASTRAPN